MTVAGELMVNVIGLWSIICVSAFFWIIYKAYEPVMAYSRYYEAYRLKVLKDELKKEGVSLEELDALGLKLFKNKKRKVHTLKEIEQSVKGDLKQIPTKPNKGGT